MNDMNISTLPESIKVRNGQSSIRIKLSTYYMLLLDIKRISEYICHTLILNELEYQEQALAQQGL